MSRDDEASANFPYQREVAFLGYNCRRPIVRYSFDGRRLVCWEKWQIRAGTIIAGAVFGPGLTSALMGGVVKPLPWYLLSILVVLNICAWIGWIDALRNRYQIVGDLVAGELKYFHHPRRKPVYTLSLDRIAAVEIDVIKRAKTRASVKPPTPDMIERYGIATIDCFDLVIVQDDGRRIYVLESTDRAVPEAIGRVLEEPLWRINRGEQLGN